MLDISREWIMVVSIKMTKEEKQLADAYAERNGVSLNEAMKKAFFEKKKMNMISH